MLLLRLNRRKPGKMAIAVALLAIFVAAFWGGAHVSQTVFDGLPHVEDEDAFLFQAKVIATGRIFVPSPPLPQFFPTQFVIDRDGKRFGKYPPGYSAVLSLGVLAGQPRLVNPLLGAISLIVIFLIGRELYSNLVGLLAAGLGVVSPFFLMQSGSYMSHPATLVFVALFVLFFVKGSRSPNLIFPILAGATLGMAYITRQLTTAGIAVPFVLYGLVDLRRGWRSVRKYGLMSFVFAIFAGLLLLYNRELTGDPFLNPYELWWPFDTVGFGPKVGGGEHTLEAALIESQINLTALADYLFGWPARLSLAFLAVPFLMRSRKLWDWLLLGSAAGLMIAYMAYWTSGEMYGPRYYYEALPMFLLLTARGMLEVWRGLSWMIRWTVVGRTSRRRGVTGGDGPHPNPLPEGEGTPLYHLPLRKTTQPLHLPLGEETRPSPLPLGEGRVRVSQFVAGTMLSLFFAVLVYKGLGEFLPSQMAFFKDWYGVTSAPVEAVKRAGIRNALVFVSEQKSWTEFATLDAANSPDYDSDIVFAAALDREDGNLMLLYPGRTYYRIVGNDIKPYAESMASGTD
ncbi:MAG: glycosyltransferase family 39 protein [Dehalococcoidia bacterium]|nr:glycosyltransferase family 39 protein [Dehalococcoidia bacterium]